MNPTLFYLLMAGLVLSGCSIVEEQNAKIKALEQRFADVESKVQAVDTANQELGKRIEQLGTNEPLERRVTYLEEKQSSMEKMQLEMVQYQDSLRTSISKVRGSMEELKNKLEEVKRAGESAQTQPASITVETTTPSKPAEKSSSVVEIQTRQKPTEKPKEKPEPRGFILDEF